MTELSSINADISEDHPQAIRGKFYFEQGDPYQKNASVS
jgi:hypothetical protein